LRSFSIARTGVGKMNAPKILSVQPQENKKLLVTFVNGIQKVYDCTQLLDREMFQLLKNDVFFKSVKVDAGGYGISWNDDLDLSEYELWINGIEIVMA
jgi:hypothetical protein